LLCLLDQTLAAIRIDRATPTAAVAYKDDITLFVTYPRYNPALADTLWGYETATGACLNIWKSKATAAGSWDKTVNMMDIPYSTEMTILEYQFSSSVGQSGKRSWTRVTGQVKAMAREVYGRDLGLTQRIQYMHAFLIAKIRHKAHFFPSQRSMLDSSKRQWHGSLEGTILRFSLSTLQRRKEDGGLELLDIEANCRALFLPR